jgi:hypothetical protein
VPFPRRPSRLIVPAALALALTAAGCSSSSSSGGADNAANDGGTTTATAHTPHANHSTTTAPDKTSVDPCKGLTAEKVTSLVGFDVEGDGTAHDNGSGFVSCQFKAPLDADPTAGATVVVGAEPAVKDGEIRRTLTEMSPDHTPTKVDVGDGGYLQASPGFAELRANAGSVQVEVNIITPMDDSIDLGPLATKVAEQVVENLS